MIKGSLHGNKGIYHVSFYIKDKNGIRKQKCLSTGESVCSVLNDGGGTITLQTARLFLGSQ